MIDLLDIIFRTVVLYGVILIIFRLMGKREIGELSILDLVVFIMMGEMAAVAIEQHNSPLMYTIVPMMILLLIQTGMAYFSLKSKKFREIIDGKPSIIINHGKIDREEMKKQRYNIDDLLMQLREKDIKNIADVEFAILETSGSLSVIKKDKKRKKGSLTLPLIIDGVIQEDNLKKTEKTEAWLRRELRKRGYKEMDKILFCSFQDGNFYIDIQDEKN